VDKIFLKMNKYFSNSKLPISWKNELNKISDLSSLDKPIRYILNEISKGKKISPSHNNIFKAFEYCSFSSTKVVIFGQDPYFQKDVANGLAFSVEPNKPLPSSLKNIYKEIESDVGALSNNDGYLKSWADQGVLLLNSALTVEVGKPGSHSKIGWQDFIFEIVKIINKKQNVVFILWGNDAKKYIKYIDKDINLILSSSHPSPLSSYRGFFGCKHFSKCNEYLESKNISKINW
jgi:uracil-DNA glycosylase